MHNGLNRSTLNISLRSGSYQEMHRPMINKCDLIAQNARHGIRTHIHESEQPGEGIGSHTIVHLTTVRYITDIHLFQKCCDW